MSIKVIVIYIKEEIYVSFFNSNPFENHLSSFSKLKAT